MKTRVVYQEKELVLLLQQNSRNGFDYLYDNYSAPLFGIILKIVKNDEIAADTLQDTFLKIWRSIASYQVEKGTLFTWMLNIARNTAIDKVRAEVKSDRLVDVQTVADQELSGSNVLYPLQVTMDLRGIVARMHPERKSLIELVYFQGYTHEEVAQRLSLPLGTVKSRIRRALQELREIFSVPDVRLHAA